MSKKILSVVAMTILAIVFYGCGSAPKRIDPKGDQGLTTVNQLDFKDWQNAAESSMKSMLASGALVRNDGRKSVVMISDVKNSTSSSEINTRLLTDKMRSAILNSQKALVTTAVGANGPDDKATREVRELENDDIFDQETVQKRGTVIAPDMSVSGEITQEYRRVGRTEESYFLFHVVLTDLKTGLAVWEDNYEVAKQRTKGIF